MFSTDIFYREIGTRLLDNLGEEIYLGDILKNIETGEMIKIRGDGEGRWYAENYGKNTAYKYYRFYEGKEYIILLNKFKNKPPSLQEATSLLGKFVMTPYGTMVLIAIYEGNEVGCKWNKKGDETIKGFDLDKIREFEGKSLRELYE
jgi:hypothetical protein